MGRRTELSATEKLLDLIRSGEDHDGPSPRENAAPPSAASPPPAAGPARAEAAGQRPEHCPVPSSPKLSPWWSTVAAKLPGLSRRHRQLTVGVALRPDTVELAVVGHIHGRRLLQEHQVYSVQQETGGGAAAPDDRWLDSAAMQATLRRALAVVQAGPDGGSRALEIWTELPWHQVDVHLLTIPPTAAAEVANAVFWAARKNIEHFNPKAHILDFVLQPKAEADGKRQAVVFLAPRAVVERLRKLFRSLGFSLAGITAPSTALRHLCLQERLSGGDRAFSHLRLEEHNSFISLFQDCDLVFSRDIKTGLQSILEVEPVVVGGREIVLPTTAGNEEEAGEPAGEGSDELVLDAAGEVQETEPARFDPRALTRLVRQLERTFDYCQANLGLPRPERIYLSSPIKLDSSLLEKIEDELGLGCDWLDPFANDQGCGPLAAAPLTRPLPASSWPRPSAWPLATADTASTSC